MEFLWWLTGVFATIMAIRFLILVFKRISSKENLEAIIDKAQDGIRNGAEKVGDYVKNKKNKKNNEPRVTIR